MAPPAPGSTLDRRTLNRALLARQSLLERVVAPAAETIERLVGLQAQVPRDPYVSLWSRLADFRVAELERLLLDRLAVRMTLMRTTLHLVTARDALALRAVVDVVCRRGFDGSSFAKRLNGADLEEVVVAARELLAAGPLGTLEIGRRLGERWPGADPEALGYAARFLIPVVQVTPRGLFGRTDLPRLAPLGEWLAGGPEPLGEATGGGTVAGGVAAGEFCGATADPDETILRYLRAFGPATVADIRTWSWLTNLRPAIDRLRPRLVTYRDESGRELLDVAGGLFATPDTPAPVRFLGEFDNLFLSHADRTRVTGDLAWGNAFRGKGAFFVDGFLAGAWRLQKAGSAAALKVEPMRALTPAETGAVRLEAEALAAFLAPDARSRKVELAE